MNKYFLISIIFTVPIGAMQLEVATIRDVPAGCVALVKKLRGTGEYRLPRLVKNELDREIITGFTNRVSWRLLAEGRKHYGIRSCFMYGYEGKPALIESEGPKPGLQQLEILYKEIIDDITSGWKRERWQDWRRYRHLSYPHMDMPDEWILLVKNTAPENTDVLMSLLVKKLQIEGGWFSHCTDPEDDGDWPGPLRPMAYCWIRKNSFETFVSALNIQLAS